MTAVWNFSATIPVQQSYISCITSVWQPNNSCLKTTHQLYGSSATTKCQLQSWPLWKLHNSLTKVAYQLHISCTWRIMYRPGKPWGVSVATSSEGHWGSRRVKGQIGSGGVKEGLRKGQGKVGSRKGLKRVRVKLGLKAEQVSGWSLTSRYLVRFQIYYMRVRMGQGGQGRSRGSGLIRQGHRGSLCSYSCIIWLFKVSNFNSMTDGQTDGRTHKHLNL